MDFISYNKSVLNRLRIHNMNTKTVVFYVGRVREGESYKEVRFPHKGMVIDAYANCGKVGESDTIIDIQKCSQHDYENGLDSWESIFSTKLTIPESRKSSTLADNPYQLAPNVLNVSPNDHFKIVIDEVGQGVSDLTVELVIELDVEP